MNVIQFDNIKTLNKEQLIHILDEYHNALGAITEALVQHSKGHISDTSATKRIEGATEVLNKYKLSDKNLAAAVDKYLGKITKEEYRDITLGVREYYNVTRQCENCMYCKHHIDTGYPKYYTCWYHEDIEINKNGFCEDWESKII